MTGRLRAAVALAAIAALAGCIAADTVSPSAASDAPLREVMEHPATASHPAFLWPTWTMLPTGNVSPWWQPIAPREIPLDPTAVELVAPLGDVVEQSGGIALFGRLLVTTGWNVGPGPIPPARVFDITDPTAPALLGEMDVGVVARDADTIAYPDGRLVVVFATDGGVIPVWNITDPTAPQELAIIQPETVSHNLGLVPGTPILYNANSQGSKTSVGAAAYPGGIPQGVTEIYDLSNPEEPQLVKVWENGYGCHAISFRIDAQKQRAYCAGVDVTQIWDIADPRAPTIVASIPAFDPTLPVTTAFMPARLSHLAMSNADGTVLIVGDETFGGLAPGCDVYTGPGDQGPLGNLYFYDIRDEANPVLVGQVSASAYFASNPPPHDGPVKVAGCTAHFGSLVPHPERELLAMAFYGAGVVLVDFTDASAPEIVAQWNDGTNVWDVWHYNGWLFTGDLSRGADVLALG